MIHAFALPELGEAVTHAIVQRWHKNVGEEVSVGDILLEITADKATLLLEADQDGTLLHQCAPKQSLVQVGQPLAAIGPAGCGIPTDLLDRQYPQADGQACLINRSALDQPEAGSPIVELNPMRRVIATRMTQSKDQAPHFYVTTSVDMSACMELRKRLKREAKARVSYNDMIIKACAMAVARFPLFGALYSEAGYILRKRRHIGFAVAVEPDGLLVPVIRDADRRSLVELSTNARELAEKARKNHLTPADYTGGVFTVSNLGSFEVDSFTAIVNPGESAILAVGKVQDTPVVVKKEVAIRPVMKMTLSSDHRVIDGALAARFNGAVKNLLENPEPLIPGTLMGG